MTKIQLISTKASGKMRVLQLMETIQIRKAHAGAPGYEANSAHGSPVYSGATANKNPYGPAKHNCDYYGVVE
jgi:hypothetical protein